MSSLIIHSATLYDGSIGGVTENGAIRSDGKTITNIGSGDEWQSWPKADEVIDAKGAPVCPGYIDIHHHGGGGVAYDEATEQAINTATRKHREHGTTRCVISFVTDNLDVMAERIAKSAEIIKKDPHILGIHPEGPFLSPAHKGAHPEKELKDPTEEYLTKILDAGHGLIKHMTLAPERNCGQDAVKTLVSRGIKASVGHTAATYEDTNEAFDNGATILTHSFNGMNGIHHRAPGPVIAALRNDNVFMEIINDTIHVHPDVVKMLFIEAPHRTVLVTDAMAATCNPDGSYMLGQLAVTVKDGIARLTEGGSLAGSTLTMDRAVANAVKAVHVSPDLAIAAATGHPAKAIGVADSYGYLKKGYPADILILDPDSYLPTAIYTEGEKIEPAK